MKKGEPPQSSEAAMLKRALTKGLDSGVSKRSPEKIRTDFRKAREAA